MIEESALIEECLLDLACSIRDEAKSATLAVTLRDIKKRAVAQGDQDTAKLMWCYEQILGIQDNFVAAFRLMKDEAYYDAWVLLERVEIALGALNRHFESRDDEFKLEFIRKKLGQFQALFPYKLFLSPAFLYKEVACSICGSPISIRTSCGHRIGEIYDGEECVRLIKALELLEVSVVENPVQKYSVVFLTKAGTDGGSPDDDHYDYSALQSAMILLREPFDEWDLQWTTRTYRHSSFRHVGRNESCPCGSGKKYKACCLPLPGVTLPHAQVLPSNPASME